MRYLTPARYRVMGTGVDLTGIPDSHLASLISRAEDTVDVHCNVPILPQPHDFRGGAVVDETHPFLPTTIRVFPKHRPIKEVQSYQVYATNDVYIEISPADVFIEPRGGWVEIVALSMSPVGFWAATGLISLTNPVLRLDYTYGWDISVTDEVLSYSPDELFRSQNQFWLETPAPVIKRNGSVITTGFSIDRTEGTVLFDAVEDEDNIITATYTHPLPSAIPQAVAVVTDQLIAERSLVAKGLGNLAEIQVEEVRLRRDARRTGTLVVAEAVPDLARLLLSPYRYVALG